MPAYDDWRETCDTLHAHTQVLGKLAAVLARTGLVGVRYLVTAGGIIAIHAGTVPER